MRITTISTMIFSVLYIVYYLMNFILENNPKEYNNPAAAKFNILLSLILVTFFIVKFVIVKTIKFKIQYLILVLYYTVYDISNYLIVIKFANTYMQTVVFALSFLMIVVFSVLNKKIIYEQLFYKILMGAGILAVFFLALMKHILQF